MSELLTAAQMRSLEMAAIESGNVTGLELMERAGRGVVEAVFEAWPDLAATSHRAIVLCGPGNNGGDGFVVARLLKDWGWEVSVYLYGDPAKLPPDAKTNYERWRKTGEVGEWNDRAIEDILDERLNDLVVDALFGTGLTRPMPEDTLRTWHGFVPNVTHQDAASRPKYVAIDAPSGLCTDSGANLDGFPADLTVTFHTAKVGHFLIRERHFGGGPGLSGMVVVKDIGLERPIGRDIVQLLEKPTTLRPKWTHEHKFSHGHALILSGGAGKTGAARLAARGALRIGAGVVTLGVPGSAQMEVAAQITALMLKRVEDGGAMTEVLEDRRINALCLGPGMGVGERGKALVRAALAPRGFHPPYDGRSVVLDADALSVLAQDDALFGMLHDRCVLTPHAGEFARLFPDIAEKLNATATKGPAYSKVDATREAAKRAGCVVLFKGPATVIAAPSGACSINAALYERAAPWLATAGSGDVLAGFITGLLARGLAPMQAAAIAAWLHVECALEFGPGLIAEDLPEVLPKVLRALDA
ncbi:yjeF C-terminal region, hydroxyethylthiazole kinase-related/yjeF N-terminal region [Roseovarius marisflavi]|uniref:Bifunctional NAD(P)H-hydrate repair enzyme n=1 Tax=Roseovarius marisflavi TaxID=1054996 RepID=A0A1M6ZN69_9RHOB|nr:bifunctional ADP-dependent NAD(P)H-hydrate dehydratase/NAD(P)H-hydrate epimerase [Roseovarius marisflavi]SHL31793.1 yjeF C-terminal region, hydroxyethylthiazole kinase-related/yjeF N-terminal region [Roseovarius marisflavi]